MAATQISIVFDGPYPSDTGALFDQHAFDMIGKLNPFITQANALAVDVNDKAAAATAAAVAGTLNPLTLTDLAGQVIGVNTAGTALEGVEITEIAVATQAQAEAGTATGVYMDPLRTKQAIDEFRNLQTWQVVTGSRANNSTYQNTTGNKITVSVICTFGADNPSASGYVGASSASQLVVNQSAQRGNMNVYFEVPNGYYYKVSSNTGIDSWLELKI